MPLSESLTERPFELPKEPFTLGSLEFYWRENYDWFLKHGYQLRSRYHPNWIPSWKLDTNLSPTAAEDSIGISPSSLNDATRLSDGKHVVLKQMMQFPEEVHILQYFSSPELSSSARNHSVPIFEVLHPPHGPENCDVVVMPILRAVDNPDFSTIGEAVDFIRQILEGFQFLHEHRVAHRDVRIENLMMDSTPLGFERFHFMRPNKTHDATGRVKARLSRTEARPKYYITDFGHASQWSPEDMPVLTLPRIASDHTLPELQHMNTPCDPFACDVYYVGNMLQTYFISGHPEWDNRNGCHGFRFLTPLVKAMTKKRPQERITMKQAVERFEECVTRLSENKLRSRLARKSGRHVYADSIRERWAKHKAWRKQKEQYIQRGLPAIPSGTI